MRSATPNFEPDAPDRPAAPGAPGPAGREPAPPAGVIVVDKPVGPSSMGAIRVVRRRAGGRNVKVGHAGTLDPLASGVLVVCVGRAATRLVPRLMDLEKRYEAVVDLRAFSSTDDAEGERTPVAVAAPPDERRVAEAIAGFVGTIQQRPPAFSAMKVGGRRAYKLARSGQSVELQARPIVIHSIDWRYDWPRVWLDVRCGKGTYIRSLARDIGLALGTGGFLESLRRTAVGPFDLSLAVPLDVVPDPLTSADLLSVDRVEALLARWRGESAKDEPARDQRPA